MSFIFAFLNGASRFVWGVLFDKFGFKPLLIINFIIQIIISLSITFIVNNVILYIASNWLIAICLSGCFTVLAPSFNKIFGMKNGAAVYGFSGIICGLSSFLGPVLSKLFVKEDLHYKILYMSSSSISVICLIVLFILKEEEFQYNQKE